jgi:hypothetical protein
MAFSEDAVRVERDHAEGLRHAAATRGPPWVEAVRAYELDMPARLGVSGSPLFRPHPLEVVGGVSREDMTVPDSERVIGFAYAYHLTTLPAARGAATDNIPLGEYLALGARCAAPREA